MSQAVKLTLTIVAILLGGLMFDLATSGMNVAPADYAHVSLSLDEQMQALNEARRQKYLTESGYYHQFFPLQKQIQLGMDTYIWFIMEKLGYLALVCVIFWLTTILRKYNVRLGRLLQIPITGYFLLLVGDMADFLLDYNNLQYGKVLGLPITYNTVSFLTYVIFVLHYVVKHGGSNLRTNSHGGYGMAHGSY